MYEIIHLLPLANIFIWNIVWSNQIPWNILYELFRHIFCMKYSRLMFDRVFKTDYGHWGFRRYLVVHLMVCQTTNPKHNPCTQHNNMEQKALFILFGWCILCIILHTSHNSLLKNSTIKFFALNLFNIMSLISFVKYNIIRAAHCYWINLAAILIDWFIKHEQKMYIWK